jgi:hypothetical protein
MRIATGRIVFKKSRPQPIPSFYKLESDPKALECNMGSTVPWDDKT